MKSLEGQTALVTGGETVLGRAIALGLAARGVAILVTGREERGLGETVGEIAHGGGKARHLPGDVTNEEHLAAALARAKSVLGGLEIVIVADHRDLLPVFCGNVVRQAVASWRRGPGRYVAALTGEEGALASIVSAEEEGLRACGIASNGIAVSVADAADHGLVDDAAAFAVFLCSRAGGRMTGQTLVLRVGA